MIRVGIRVCRSAVANPCERGSARLQRGFRPSQRAGRTAPAEGHILVLEVVGIPAGPATGQSEGGRLEQIGEQLSSRVVACRADGAMRPARCSSVQHLADESGKCVAGVPTVLARIRRCHPEHPAAHMILDRPSESPSQEGAVSQAPETHFPALRLCSGRGERSRTAGVGRGATGSIRRRPAAQCGADGKCARALDKTYRRGN
jgi:hypothetical protein